MPANSSLKNFSSADILSSLVVFLVAIPLCLGIAIASSADPAAGLISGIIGGIVVGLMSGAPLQVSGPAAGLVVLTYQVITQHGMAGLMAVLVIAGTLQIVCGLCRIGTWFRAVTPAVVQGMLAGIGVLIFAGQIHVMLGNAKPPHKEGILNLLAIPNSIWKAVRDTDPLTFEHAALTGVLTIIVMLSWKKFLPKKLTVIPAALVGVISAGVLIYFTGWQVNMVTVGNLWDKVHLFGTEQLALLKLPGIWGAGLGMGFVASAESLLCATAITRIQKIPYRTDYNKEIIAQGIGNTICGLIGGLPITGVIVRSAANVDAGGRTRYSAVLHGCWILLFVCLAPQVLGLIPISALAAILVLTGYKLVDLAAIKNLAKYGRENIVIYFVTLLSIVCTDLLIGVIIGAVLSALFLLHRFSHLTVQTEHEDDEAIRMNLTGSATFMSLPTLAHELDTLPPRAKLHVDLSRLSYIDHACLELLMNWEKQHESRGGQLFLDWGALTAKLQNRPAQVAAEKVKSG